MIWTFRVLSVGYRQAQNLWNTPYTTQHVCKIASMHISQLCNAYQQVSHTNINLPRILLIIHGHLDHAAVMMGSQLRTLFSFCLLS